MSEEENIGRPPTGAEVDRTGFSDVAAAVDDALLPAWGRRWLSLYLPPIIIFVAGILLWEL